MNIAVTTAVEGFPRRAFMVEDISRMIEAGIIGGDEKFELIQGEIVTMAARGIVHERIKSALIVAIGKRHSTRATASKSTGSSTPTSASPGSTPNRGAAVGPRL
jgi:Uma2 family endonuclease